VKSNGRKKVIKNSPKQEGSPLPSNLKRQIKVSLRGGTTKQPAYRQAGLLVYAEFLFVKINGFTQLMYNTF
jgi:hypothetical protein